MFKKPRLFTRSLGALGLALLLALCTLPGTTASPALAWEQELYLPELFQSTPLSLEPYLGKVMVINFFTEWCPYCMEEMPDFKRLYDSYRPEELEIIFVHAWIREDERNTESVRKKYGLEELTFFEDEDLFVVRFVGVPGYPTTLVVDKEGYLYGAFPYMLTYDLLEDMMETLSVSPRLPEEEASSD